MKQFSFLVFYFFFSLISLYAWGQKESLQTEVSEKPSIRLAYSWGHGFKSTISEYASRISDQYILEPEESIGLNHKQKILIDASSNTLPDVFLFWSYETNLKYLAEHGHLLDVQQYFDSSESIQRSDFNEHNLNATEIDGINYAVPHEWFFGFLAANKSIFNDFDLPVPRLWDDFKIITPVLLKNGIIPLHMGSYRGDPGHLFFSALTYQEINGYSDTVRIKQNRNFIYPGTIKATEAVLDLIKYEAIPKNTIYTGSFEQQISDYNSRKAAMTFSFSWSLALFDKDVAEDTIIIPVPRISEDSRDTSSFTIGGSAQGICINQKSWNDPEKQKAIINLVDWLLSEEVYQTRMLQAGMIPAKKMELPVSDNSIYSKVLEYVEPLEVLGIHEFYFNSLNSFNIYKEANDLLWSGAITGEDFLNMVQKGVKQNND